MGLGLTVKKNVTGVPLQPLAVGVTVIVAVIGEFPVFVAVNGLMSPVPDAGNPIAVLLFVQLKLVPGIVPLKVMAVLEAPVHIAWLPG